MSKNKKVIASICIFLSVILLAGGIFMLAYKELILEELPAGFTYTAHTGCVETADNSIAAIEAGAKHGAQIVEFDLYFTQDERPVLSHDAPKGGEVTLDEAFAAVARYDALRVNVDVKISIPALSQVVSLAQKHGIEDRIFFTGLFENTIETAKAACPGVPCWLNADVKPAEEQTQEYLQSLVDLVKSCGAVGINMHKNNATKELVELFHANGLGVSLWTANSLEDIHKALAVKPDNITTRRPDIMQVIFSNGGEKND